MPDISKYIDSKISEFLHFASTEKYDELLKSMVKMLEELNTVGHYTGVKQWLYDNNATSLINLNTFYRAYKASPEDLEIETTEQRNFKELVEVFTSIKQGTRNKSIRVRFANVYVPLLLDSLHVFRSDVTYVMLLGAGKPWHYYDPFKNTLSITDLGGVLCSKIVFPKSKKGRKAHHTCLFEVGYYMWRSNNENAIIKSSSDIRHELEKLTDYRQPYSHFGDWLKAARRRLREKLKAEEVQFITPFLPLKIDSSPSYKFDIVRPSQCP